MGKVRLGPNDICDQVCGTILLEFCGPSKGELISWEGIFFLGEGAPGLSGLTFEPSPNVLE